MHLKLTIYIINISLHERIYQALLFSATAGTEISNGQNLYDGRDEDSVSGEYIRERQTMRMTQEQVVTGENIRNTLLIKSLSHTQMHELNRKNKQ